jgi:hypothetical protein
MIPQAYEPLTLQDINGTRRDAQTLEECGQGLRRDNRHFRPKRVDDRSEMTAAKLPFAAFCDCDYDFLK